MKRVVIALLAVVALAHAPSVKAVAVITVPGGSGVGPKAFDHSSVQIFGPRTAGRVLVLVPGAYAGAGEFSLIAPEIVRRVPNLQVWAWDRREQQLVDRTGFLGRDPNRAAAYYLRGASIAGHAFSAVPAEASSAAARWGLDVQLRDLRVVLRTARAGGRRRVILGGEGVGGSTALAYSTWDFRGHAGWRDISGLVLIDGALMTGKRERALPESEAQLGGSPFADPLASGSAPRLGILAELEAMYAERSPRSPAALAGDPSLPAALRPPRRVTNQALLGFDFDSASALPALAPLLVRSGRLARSGDPQPWRDSGNTPILRLQRLFRAPNATEWYFPKRLATDVAALDPLRSTDATRQLGLRAFHVREVAVPLLAFESDFGHGEVNAGARRFVRASRVPRAVFTAAHGFSALDSLAAVNSRNYALRSLVSFLKSAGPTRR